MKFTIAKSNNPISKRFSLEGGGVEKNDGGNLTLATFDTQKNLSIKNLHDYVKSDECHDKVIFIPGVSQFQDGLIVTKSEILRRERDNEEQKQHLISRSKDCFSYVGGEGFILLDYDPNEEYKLNDGEPLTKDLLLCALHEAMPELKNAPMFWKTSSSSNIWVDDGEGQKLHRGVSGQHIFLAVKNTLDIRRAVDVLYKRLWLKGHGYVFIDKTGRMHDRTIIDKVVNSPEREIFLKAECTPPVYQTIEYDLILPGNQPLDTSLIQDLTSEEEVRFVDLVDKEKKKKAKLSESVMSKYVIAMASTVGMSPLKMRECIKNRVLFGDTHIKLSTGVEVTVSELFKKPELYDGAYCYDPLEPEYGGVTGGSTKAWIDLDNRRIHGHAHGGIHYDLEISDRKSPLQLALEVADTEDHNILFKLAANGAHQMRYISTEIDQLIAHIVDVVGVKKGSAKKAFMEKYNAITGGDFNSSGITVDLHSSALDEDGNVIHGMEQSNLSIPVHHKFPHTIEKNGMEYKIDTVENFQFMCKVYGIGFRYDTIFKSSEITFPNNEIPDGDNNMNASISRMKSLAALNGLGKGSIDYIAELVNDNAVNPVLDWIKGVVWDGKPRIELVQDGMAVNPYGSSDDEEVNIAFSNSYKKRATMMWFIQCMAALDAANDSPLNGATGLAIAKYEYLLVFVGNQGIQKTKFLKSLLPFELNQYILTGHELDLKDKDNIKIAISHWIAELGELDSTFRKSDISALKAFMSKEDDQMRMPYARSDSKFKRRTSFCGSVNEEAFLVDTTGNRRYIPLKLNSILPLYELHVDWVTEDGVEIEVMKGIGEGLHEGDGDDVGFINGFTESNSVYGVVEVEGKKVAGRYKCIQMSNIHQTQQFWAEVYHHYCLGEQWWPNKELEQDLSYVLGIHQRVDPVLEGLVDKFDVSWSDKRRKGVKGEFYTDKMGARTRFVTLTLRSLVVEVGVDPMHKTSVNSIKNYLTGNGIQTKMYRVGSKTIRGMRLALNPGQRLLSETGVLLPQTRAEDG